ncbi:extracellular serine-rich protein, putative [Talaromyces stipitatus ATCC 10500]|uniref:Extracellular serine-rich protein, putative n=1 Tax=Talaromyces stipitatus (strain ATCC 10500 / CBS 375.48 / QM 6759 / NRRL 1006) TaxID=441959 RepID=B8MI28_TALSN|nr:extracellular serine-rich protein, putative [Talaromyces stipitatus ATCC 10500]EED17190.1 extracellular serine-rich protein, putative [Talaromyces stipitatus ATCC 10500]
MVQILRSISILCWVALVSAQYGNPGTTAKSATTTSVVPSSTSSSTAVQTIAVGKNGFTFDPDTLTVSPGGKVEFHFYPGPHSVARASFENPCHPTIQTGIFSGSVPGSNGGSSTVLTLTINDTNPIWYYCGEPGHCQAGMVGVINPPSNGSNTITAFKASAANANGSTVPASVAGGVWGASTSGLPTSSQAASGISSSSPTPTGEARTLHAWTDMSTILIFSVLVALCMM